MEENPLADSKLPPLMKQHRQLPFFRRVWFYIRLACRGLLLACVWTPVLLSGFVLPTHLWMRMVVRLLERCGAVFIKLGQWAATRPDLFPHEVCDQLAKLQANVRPHSYAASVAACKENFGANLTAPDGRRLVIDEQVLGSGSMGQVHHGLVVAPDGAQTEVAIKVLHPDIHARVNMDLTLLYCLAATITRIPYSELQWLSIPEMLVQFAEFMSSHLNLVQEGANMTKFRKNFRCKSVKHARTHALRRQKQARKRTGRLLSISCRTLLIVVCACVCSPVPLFSSLLPCIRSSVTWCWCSSLLTASLWASSCTRRSTTCGARRRTSCSATKTSA